MAAVDIELIGPMRVHVSGRDITPAAAKLRQLLCLLALAGDAVVDNETIVRELWDAEPSAPRLRAVQTYVSQLRALLGADERGPVIANVSRVGYRLLDGMRRCDVHEVARLRAAAESRVATGDRDGAAESLGRAVALCRGPALGGVRTGPVLRRRRAQLEALRHGCLEGVLDLHASLGRPDQVLAVHDRTVGHEIDSDLVRARVIGALAAVGRTESAARFFREMHAEVMARTGMEPGEVVQEAYRTAMRTHRGTTPPPPAPRVAAPLVTPGVPEQLPLPPTTFVGFSAELAVARAALGRPTGRPVDRGDGLGADLRRR